MTKPSPSAADDASRGDDRSVEQRVHEVVDLMRPAIQSDEGDVEVVDITDDGVVKVRFHGACVTCPSKTITLQMGLEANIRQRAPEVTQVIAVD